MPEVEPYAENLEFIRLIRTVSAGKEGQSSITEIESLLRSVCVRVCVREIGKIAIGMIIYRRLL